MIDVFDKARELAAALLTCDEGQRYQMARAVVKGEPNQDIRADLLEAERAFIALANDALNLVKSIIIQEDKSFSEHCGSCSTACNGCNGLCGR